jgi:2,4-dienoyl-CoA reductase-like NADH-dependent reductase (Old Yellow Enzyme family)
MKLLVPVSLGNSHVLTRILFSPVTRWAMDHNQRSDTDLQYVQHRSSSVNIGPVRQSVVTHLSAATPETDGLRRKET